MVVRARPVEDGRTTAIEALHAFATLPDWLSAPADPERVASVLSRRVPELASGELTLMKCEVRSVRIRKHALVALYRVEVAAGDGRPPRAVGLRGELVPPGLPEPDAATSGAPVGSATWRCWVPELRLDLTTEPPGDPALPALSLLRDAEAARVLLERAIRAGSPPYADLRIEACSVRVARYQPGSRCTILYRLRFPPGAPSQSWPETVVAKTHRDGKGRNAYEDMRALWSSELRRAGNVTIAEPLAFLSELNVLVQAGIPHECTLQELLRSSLRARRPNPMGDLVAYLAKTARGLADLHACRARSPEVVTWEDELEEVRAAVARLGELTPELAESATPFLVRLEGLARESPADSLRPAHRSFRPAQVLLHGGTVGFIDFDGFCWAEPAIDVALFRAIVKDVGLQTLQAEEGTMPDGQPRPEHLAQLDELCEVFSLRYEAAAPISRRRVALWEALDLLTLVLHGWTKVKSNRLSSRLGLLGHHLHASELDA
jgi:aminoglycoside phosphotransferase (APT) family kinase protein